MPMPACVTFARMAEGNAATGVAPSLADQYANIVRYLEDLETVERTRSLPHLTERAPPLEISDVRAAAAQHDSDKSKEDVVAALQECGTVALLTHRNLRSFDMTLHFPASIDVSFANITKLDVGNNELTDLPGLSSLTSLRELVLTRNWFNTLPSEIGSLQQLETLDASRNFLRPNGRSLRFDDLGRLPAFSALDLSYNQKCGRPHHRELILSEVPQLREVKITTWEKICSTPNSYVGTSAADRDPALLRSQLEPLGTVQLRRRLVQDFGQEPTDPEVVDRAEVMERLLACYREEGLMEMPQSSSEDDSSNLNDGVGKRHVVHVDGAAVSKPLLDELLAELRSWRGDRSRGGSLSHRERPSINARCYMILRAPDANDRKLEGQVPDSDAQGVSRRAQRTAKKMERNRRLFDAALDAMREVDPAFAGRCTEIAVTYGFQGSPHIDKQNCGPFYGLALGDFAGGTGQVCVECSARVLACVNTKNRLGRIDGRYPHWVAPYDVDKEERFSLIYYETGGTFVAPGPAVFNW
jgi:hypothetical protein